jgi:SAM-dependent methyltransferase
LAVVGQAGEESGARAQEDLGAFDRWWRDGVWGGAEPSELGRRRFSRMYELVSDRRYARALEIGCGAGAFARMVARLTERLLAIDVSPEAIALATAEPPPGNVAFRVQNAMELDWRSEGPWDLVIASETWAYLGWTSAFYYVGWLAREIFETTRPGGRLLAVDTISGAFDELLEPWLVRTYRDLLRNVGFDVEREETLAGSEAGQEFEFLLTVYGKPDV